MKKLFVFFVFTIIPFVSNAQRVDKPDEPYEFYCVTEVDFFKHRTSHIELAFAGETCVLIDENGEEIKVSEKAYNSLDLRLYMAKRGWEFVSSNDFASTYHLTLRKIVTSDEQAKEGLRLKTINSREGVSPFLEL